MFVIETVEAKVGNHFGHTWDGGDLICYRYIVYKNIFKDIFKVTNSRG